MAADDPLCSLADLATLIQVPIATADEPAAQAAIDAASAAIRGYCGQVLTLVAADRVLVSPCWGRVFLPELPVLAVSAVSLAGTALDAGAWSFDGRTGELVRFDPNAVPPPWPSAWDAGYRNVDVTYDHGWAVLPADLVDVAARVASRRYLGGMRSALVGPHARESEYASIYQQEPPGEVAGAYGPTSAVILTGDERRTLDRRYSVARIG